MTIRARLTLMLFCTLAPVMVAAGLGLYLFVRTALHNRFDDGLATRVEALIADTEVYDGRVAFDFDDEAMPQYELRARDGHTTAFFELYELTDDHAMRIVERSRSLADRSIISGSAADVPHGPWDLTLRGGLDIRALARTFLMPRDPPGPGTPPPEHRLLIVVAAPREPVDNPLHALAVGLFLAGTLITVAGVLGVRWALRRGLAPIDHLAAAVGAVHAPTLGTPIDAGPLPAELAPIRDRLNDLLARLHAAFERERRFTTAAAHELRTPVAELRTLLEVSAARPRAPEETARTLASSLGIAERLDALVSALLRLARVESGRERADAECFDIWPLLRAALAEAHGTAAARRVRFSVQVPEPLLVMADAELLAPAVRNIVMNAAEYADEDSAVRITMEPPGNGAADVALHFSNISSGVRPEAMGRMGEPFWRQEAARSAPHLGLGLSLAGAAASAAGARLEIGAVPEGGAARVTVSLHFPARGAGA